MIEGREREADQSFPTLAAWLDYLRATAGGLAIAAGRALGADRALLDRLGELGAAYGVAGQLRNVSALARSGRCLLPEDVLDAYGLTLQAVTAAPHSARVRPAMEELAGQGKALLARARGAVPRSIVAAALPAVLARRDLARLGRAPVPRGFADRFAIVTAALRGIV
jgi:phytoene synthase